jgi:hypothetical protein
MTNLANKPPRRNHPPRCAISNKFTVSAREGDRLDQNQPAVDCVGTEKLGEAELAGYIDAIAGCVGLVPRAAEQLLPIGHNPHPAGDLDLRRPGNIHTCI